MENSKWISVNDDLPEYGEPVIWFSEDGKAFIAAMNPENYPLPLKITFWQNLPEPPGRAYDKGKMIKAVHGNKKQFIQ